MNRLIPTLGLAVTLVAAPGCAHLPWSSPAPEPGLPPWDMASPPYLVPHPETDGPEVTALTLDDPEPIPMGLPPEEGRYLGILTVHHYDVEVVIPPENDRYSARTTIHYQSSIPGPHFVKLDLTGVRVEAVTWRGTSRRFTHDDGLLEFVVPGTHNTWDTLQVSIMTRGRPTDGLILRDNVHGEPVGFADNWPNRARFWFPSLDHPSHKATVSFTVHAPTGRRVVANGRQVGGPVPAAPARAGGLEGMQTWRWGTGVPIPTYLMVIGVADMVVMDGGLGACGRAPASPRPDGCVEVTAWAFPPDTAHARYVFRRSAEMLDLYADVFGPYPYEKLANVQSSTRFGGMENASAIFYSEQAIAQGRDIEGTVAHEIVHQWFGNSITPADWPHLWLSEGFASYFGPYFWEQAESEAEFQRRIAQNRDRYLASDVTHRPVVDRGSENLLDLLNANSYQKGSLVLHMLRWVMGDPAFFRGIRAYYARHAGGNVETRDFEAVMENAYDGSLNWFFEQWLHSPGYPVYRASWSWDPRTRRAHVTIRQEQDEAWPVFRMPMELEFSLEDGGFHREILWVEGREWSATVGLPSPPRELRMDPEGWLLHREAGR
jgi:aminopeptidase N